MSFVLDRGGADARAAPDSAGERRAARKLPPPPALAAAVDQEGATTSVGAAPPNQVWTIDGISWGAIGGQSMGREVEWRFVMLMLSLSAKAKAPALDGLGLVL